MVSTGGQRLSGSSAHSRSGAGSVCAWAELEAPAPPAPPAAEGALRDVQVCTDLRGLLRVCWRVSRLPAEGPDGKHFSRRGPYTGSSHMPLCPFCFCFHSPLKTQITLVAPRSRRRGWAGLRGPRFAGTHMRPRLCSEPSRPRCAEVHNRTLRRKSRRCHRTEPSPAN